MRQVRLLESRAQLTVAGYGRAPDAACQFVAIPNRRLGQLEKARGRTKLMLRLFESYYWSRPEIGAGLALLRASEFDLVIANDIASLPLALKIASGKPVLTDAHEYSPREFEESFAWRLLFGAYQDYMCRTYLPRAAAMTTVCQGIAEAFHEAYGVPAQVVMNAPALQHREPAPLIPGRMRLIHHGASLRARHLEVMIDMMDLLDERFSLDLMLVETDPAYLAQLRRRAAGKPRIRFLPAVRMEEICAHISAYDIGLYLLPPVNFNHEHALPNKLFEFVQARLAVAIGPSPEMARIVREYSLGVVASSFDPAELARELNGITDADLRRYKQAAHRAAPLLSYERNSEVLTAEIQRLLKQPQAATA
ncbi:MAG: hypothetical protein JWR85_3875 [Marmoricola sp.]|nr:hypothetical protein [Marmoricola sp.]